MHNPNDPDKRGLIIHRQLCGEISIQFKMPLRNRDVLALAYTPGVADPSQLTIRGNTAAVISDGLAVLACCAASVTSRTIA